MARNLSKTGIENGELIKAAEISQSIDALTGQEAYNITISGSLNITGSVVTGSISEAISASFATSALTASFALNTGVSGIFNLTGSTQSTTNNIDITGSTTITQTLAANAISASTSLNTSIYQVKGNNVIFGTPDIINGTLNISDNNNFPQITYGRSGNNNIAHFFNGSITASNNISSSGTVFGITGSFPHLITEGDTIEFINPSTRAKEGTLKFDPTNGLQVDNDSGARAALKVGDLGVTSDGKSIRLLGGNITASNNISSSGTVFGITGSFPHLIGDEFRYNQDNNLKFSNLGADISARSSINLKQNITSSYNLRIKGYISSSNFLVDNGDITTSGNVSSSGAVYSNGNYQGDGHSLLRVNGETLTFAGSATRGGFTSITYGRLTTTNQKFNGPITASGHISASGDITSSGQIFADGNLRGNNLILDNGGSLASPAIRLNNDTNNGIFFPAPDNINFVNAGATSVNFNTSAATFTIPLTVGSTGTGYDVTFFGDTNGKYFKWDQSADKLEVRATEIELDGPITASGNISASGTITALSGSFSHLIGSSPITIGSPANFLSPITASNNISSSQTIISATSSVDLLSPTTDNGALIIEGLNLFFQNLPTIDPGVSGQLYNRNGVVTISD